MRVHARTFKTRTYLLKNVSPKFLSMGVWHHIWASDDLVHCVIYLLLQALIFSSWLSNEHERPGVRMRGRQGAFTLSLFLPPSLLPLSPTSLSLFLRSVSFGGSEAKANRSRKVSFQFFHRMCQNFGLESEMQFPGISAPRRATVSYSFKDSLNYYLNSNIYRVFNFTNNLPISSPK